MSFIIFNKFLVLYLLLAEILSLLNTLPFAFFERLHSSLNDVVLKYPTWSLITLSEERFRFLTVTVMT